MPHIYFTCPFAVPFLAWELYCPFQHRFIYEWGRGDVFGPGNRRFVIQQSASGLSPFGSAPKRSSHPQTQRYMQVHTFATSSLRPRFEDDTLWVCKHTLRLVSHVCYVVWRCEIPESRAVLNSVALKVLQLGWRLSRYESPKPQQNYEDKFECGGISRYHPRSIFCSTHTPFSVCWD